MTDANLTVGKVAKRAGVKVSTLHFYEQKGLITSWRNSGNQRRYKAEVLRRIAVIKAAQKMGINLDEIKLALASLPNNRTPNKQDWQKLSSAWHKLLDKRIQQLQVLRDSISSCIGCGCLSLSSCPIYNENDKMAEVDNGPVIMKQALTDASNFK